MSKVRLFFCITIIFIASFVGSKIFYIATVWHTDSARNLLQIHLHEPSGRVFYGALAGACLALWLLAALDTKTASRHYWNTASLLAAFGYGLLRIGCFAEGCCWGRMTSVPWAVTYVNAESAMPYRGIPVHPVQLYDAILGFLIFALLLNLKGRIKYLAPVFLLCYAIGRFFTEMFRGDAIRGINVFHDLSTSQVLSFTTLVCAIASFVVLRRARA